MATYRDILLKTSFYKEQILKEMIKKGLPPDDKLVDEKVRNIDKFLALFDHEKIKPGTDFDVKKFNEELKLIQQDLLFLYRLMYELAIEEYTYTKAYVDSHLKELEGLARRYKLRSQIEMESTFLGETIFFQASGFNMFNKDNETYIDLGTISVREGSRVAWLFDANNVQAQNAVMGLKNGDEITYIGAHNYISDTFQVPGSPEIKDYFFNLDEDQIVNKEFEISAEGLEPSNNKQYIIFGGLDQMLVKSGNREIPVSKDSNDVFYTEETGIIEFYIYNGTYANFSFSKQPTSKNFNGITIENLKRHHKVAMRIEDGIGFTVTTNGRIYAAREVGVIRDDKLYYPKKTDIRDFFIEENTPGNLIEYNAFLRVVNDDIDLADINSVAIKELTDMEVQLR